MAEKKASTGKKYRLLWPKRNENKKQYVQGQFVSLDHLSQKDVDYLLKIKVYKEVN